MLALVLSLGTVEEVGKDFNWLDKDELILSKIELLLPNCHRHSI